MPNTVTSTALPFSPTAATLESAIALLAELGTASGGAVAPHARRDAFARYESAPPPGLRAGRGWKHDYSKLRFDELSWSAERLTMAAVPSRPAAPATDVEPGIDQPALATANAGGLFHLGSTLMQPPDAVASDPRFVLLPLADALREHPELVALAHNAVANRDDKFASLAQAFQNCGAFVYIPEGVVLDAPLQLLFGTQPDAAAVFPQIVVVLGRGARATILERHVGDGEAFVCGTVEAHLGEGAALDYVAVQQSGEEARVFFNRAARCERDAVSRFFLAELGGSLVRGVTDAVLDGEGAKAETAALFFNTGLQHVDLTTNVRHAVGNTVSDTVVRTAATDRGQGRFVGNIIIEKKAHGSDASLRDDALLLSRQAHIDSIPALEIAANDVKAFHGATVGSLDEDALFYVGSRGIARNDAVRLVALAFFEPAIARFPSDALRDEVRTALDRKIDEAVEIDA